MLGAARPYLYRVCSQNYYLGGILSEVQFVADVSDRQKRIEQQKSLFEAKVLGLKSSGSDRVRPVDLYSVQQIALDCADALDDFDRSMNSENEKHAETNETIRYTYEERIEDTNNSAKQRCQKIIDDVKAKENLAKVVDVSIASVTGRSADHVLVHSVSADAKGKNYSEALGKLSSEGREFDEKTFGLYLNFGGWGAGGMAIFSWIAGANFLGGLLLGGVVFGIAMVMYSIRRGKIADSLRTLVRSAEAEFSKIRDEMQQAQSQAKTERDEKLKAELSRFNAVKEACKSFSQVSNRNLVAIHDDFVSFTANWVDRHQGIIAATSAPPDERDSEVSGTGPLVFYSKIGTVHAEPSATSGFMPSAGDPSQNMTPDHAVGQQTGQHVSQGADPQIIPKIDEAGQAKMLFDHAMELFEEADDDGEKKREALLILAQCSERFPFFIKAHCVLARACLFLDDVEEAIGYSAQAYDQNPHDEEAQATYASCMTRKGIDQWENDHNLEAFDTVLKALQIGGFELQRFAVFRHLANETNQLERFAHECTALGIDPLQDVDLDELRG